MLSLYSNFCFSPMLTFLISCFSDPPLVSLFLVSLSKFLLILAVFRSGTTPGCFPRSNGLVLYLTSLLWSVSNRRLNGGAGKQDKTLEGRHQRALLFYIPTFSLFLIYISFSHIFLLVFKFVLDFLCTLCSYKRPHF